MATAAMVVMVIPKRSRATDNPLAIKLRGHDPQSKAAPRDTEWNTKAPEKIMFGRSTAPHLNYLKIDNVH